MGMLNRLAMRGLVKAQGIVKQRIELANTALEKCASAGMGPRSPEMMHWQMHKAKMVNRFAALSIKIADRARREAA